MKDLRQASLFEHDAPLAGVMPAIKSAMKAALEGDHAEGRKSLPDKLNAIARQNGVKLTGGNVRAISKDTLDKWLSGDEGRAPSILAVLAFCMATGDLAPLRAMARALGVDIMTNEDRRLRDLGKLEMEMKAARKRRRMLEAEL